MTNQQKYEGDNSMKHASLMIATALLASMTAFGARAGTTAPSTTPAPAMSKMGAHHAMMSRQRVEAIQTALKSNGEQVDPDGVWGPKTVAAVRDFQTKQGLKVTGHVDRATAQKLNLPGRST
jgi:peptidoglycan hydrolase-like protein with peptidoglycan-binding domain